MINTPYSIQEESGAVIFHQSPESVSLKRIKKELDEVNKKLDFIIDSLSLKEESDSGKEVEN